MYSDEFEKFFGDFLDDHFYDLASDSLFRLCRAAFLSGWLAAGGTHPCRELDFSDDRE